ncbi:hypothetical protein DIPPA_29523 [Diplonema papillatum]|nr:hypothetical protein DIPPA_29523 [Diplonema papillatum]
MMCQVFLCRGTTEDEQERRPSRERARKGKSKDTLRQSVNCLGMREMIDAKRASQLTDYSDADELFESRGLLDLSGILKAPNACTLGSFSAERSKPTA